MTKWKKKQSSKENGRGGAGGKEADRVVHKKAAAQIKCVRKALKKAKTFEVPPLTLLLGGHAMQSTGGMELPARTSTTAPAFSSVCVDISPCSLLVPPLFPHSPASPLFSPSRSVHV